MDTHGVACQYAMQWSYVYCRLTRYRDAKLARALSYQLYFARIIYTRCTFFPDRTVVIVVVVTMMQVEEFNAVTEDLECKPSDLISSNCCCACIITVRYSIVQQCACYIHNSRTEH